MRVMTLALGVMLSLSTLWPLNQDDVRAKEPTLNEVVKEISLKGLRLPRFVRQPPVKITTAEELAKAITDKEVQGQILKQVDFTTHYLVFFAWAGSGQDKLTFQVEGEKDHPVVVFNLSPGRTRDLRQHRHLYVITKKATWSTEEKRTSPLR